MSYRGSTLYYGKAHIALLLVLVHGDIEQLRWAFCPKTLFTTFMLHHLQLFVAVVSPVGLKTTCVKLEEDGWVMVVGGGGGGGGMTGKAEQDEPG